MGAGGEHVPQQCDLGGEVFGPSGFGFVGGGGAGLSRGALQLGLGGGGFFRRLVIRA